MLERPRRASVDDEPNIRPVDTHAEGDGGDDDVDTFAQERILIAFALPIRETRMIWQGRGAKLGQPPC